MIRHPLISDEEHAYADKMRAFSNSPDVVDLFDQLNMGLITPVEYACKVLDEAARAGLWPREG